MKNAFKTGMSRVLWITALCAGFSPLAHAIENLGPSCEWSLRTDARFPISPAIAINLQENQILVRGKLEAFWETGMEDRTGWSIMDEFYDRKVLEDPWDSLYMLEKGDRLFVLNEQGNVVVAGYYKERNIRRNVHIMGQLHETRPNVPGLFKDIELTESLISPQKLADYFQKGAPAVMVRTLTDEQMTKMRKKMGPLLMKHYQHLLSEKRLVRVNENLTLETGHFENVIRGEFTFAVAPFERTGYDAKGTPYPLPPELAFKPIISPYETAEPQTLEHRDDLILLDHLGQVVMRTTIGTYMNGAGLIAPQQRTGERLDDLLKKLRSAVSAIVIRRRALQN